MRLSDLRKEYHQNICKNIIRIRKDKTKEYPNFADSGNRASMKIAWNMIEQFSCEISHEPVSAQTLGDFFELYTKNYLEKSFALLAPLRPGKWLYSAKSSITDFDQYEHLANLEKIVSKNKILSSALGGDYIVKPDIVVARQPVSDDEVNCDKKLFDKTEKIAMYTPLLSSNSEKPYPILHASISCKWTIRSDRSQNTRTEALNLIRNRKGNLPHIAAVTAEPLPTRLAALALGTGDLDCVYHFALPELIKAIDNIKNEDQSDMLHMIIDGKRLRDISDLPFDLSI
ncbi:MAG: NgoMIV family type II restriction endonuclease [Desulfobacterales bacterium]